MALNQYAQKQIDDAQANRQKAIQVGDDTRNYLNNKTNYYDANEDAYRGKADAAYQDLADTPGYTADQQKQITGDPNAAQKFYDPGKLAGDAAGNKAELSGAVGDYSSGLHGAADQLASNVTGAAGDYSTGLQGAAGAAKSGLADSAAHSTQDLNQIGDDQGKWQSGVYGYQRGENEKAYGGLDEGLDSAVDRSKLGLSDKFAGDYALSGEQAQNIKNVAGDTVRGQYQREQDQLGQQAFAQGNSSPAQIAAMQEQLGRQGAMDAGTAMSSAELAANTEAAKRQQTTEAMRLGTEQDLSSREQANAGTKYGAATGAANTLAQNELGGINAVQNTRLAATTTGANLGYGAAATGAQYGYNAADQGGQAKIDAAKTVGGYNYSAAGSAGQAAIDASKTSGAQTLGVDAGNQATGQALATQADNTGSGRATTIANTGIAGQDKVRGYYTGQQASAQQGAQTATGQGIQSSGTQGALAGQATQTGASTTIGQNQVDKSPGEGERVGQGVLNLFAKGGVITQPTEGIVGEHGPEMIVPIGGPRRRYRMAA